MVERKVLGQLAPSATTNSDLYSVPPNTSTVCSTLIACNRSSSAIRVRVAVRPAAAAISNEHYLFYDTTVPANDSMALTLGLTLAATDVVTVYSSSASASFSLFGEEVS